MAFNYRARRVVGIVPFAGDLFDAAFKANQRNVALLDAWLDQPRRTERSTRAFAALIVSRSCGAGAGSARELLPRPRHPRSLNSSATASLRFFSGRLRTGLPVAAWIAFMTEGATTQIVGSPTPPQKS
jgi:hypothetical protein